MKQKRKTPLASKFAFSQKLPVDWLVVTAIMVVALVPLALNMFKPLWFDEVWRAQIISSWRMHRFDGEAPLTLIPMLLTKAITLVYNNEFTQRLLFALTGLGLIPLLYVFGKYVRGRKFGLLLAVTPLVTLYYLEYLVQNKIYVVDLVLTLIFVLLFFRYLHKQLSPWWFLAFGVVYMLSSTSSLYLFVAAGVWQLYLLWRHKESLRRLLVWALPLGILYPIYYLTFLRPQITPGLLQFFQIDDWRGQSLHYVIKYIAKHAVSSFGFNVTNLWPNVSINYPIDQTGIISFAPVNPAFVGAATVFGLFVVTWFIIGTISLVRRGYGFIPFTVALIWVLSLLLSFFSISPFGNNRANLFLFGLMAVIAWLGLYELLAWLWRRKDIWAQAGVVGVIVACAWFVPVDALRARLVQPRPLAYLDGMSDAAKIVRTGSKPGQLVANYHFMNMQSFSYYYNYYQPNVGLNAHPSENLVYDSLGKPLSDSTDYYRQLSQHYQTVWVVWGAGIGHNVTVNAQGCYHVDELSDYGSVSVAKLTKI